MWAARQRNADNQSIAAVAGRPSDTLAGQAIIMIGGRVEVQRRRSARSARSISATLGAACMSVAPNNKRPERCRRVALYAAGKLGQ